MQIKPDSDLTLAALMQVTASDQPDVFEGQTEAYGRLGIYGGHFLGQALAAAFETVEQPKVAHSFHAYFLRPGDPSARLTYHVNSLRDSRGGATRSISARQNERDCFHMVASFKLPESGDEHQKTAPIVASAEQVIADREAIGQPLTPFPMVQGGRVEMELIGKGFNEFDPQREPALKTWMRVPAALPGAPPLSPRDRQIVLAYLSDGTLMFNSVLPHGRPFVSHRLTSLDQCVWFHRETDPGQWLLFDQRSTAAADGRGMNEGEIYDTAGNIVMSCAQESMLRAMPVAGAKP
jgi:acyl-CoA thioesterase-2